MSQPPPALFASVGSMFPFDRLVKAIDAWAEAHPHIPVEVQIGRGAYQPTHARFTRMMPPALYQQRIREAQLFVAHAGMGSIISAIEAGKPLLMLPRLRSLGEHTTDHQLATVAKFENRTGLHVANDVPALHSAIDRLLADSGASPAPIAPHASPALIANIKAFIAA